MMNDLVPIETLSWEQLQQYVYYMDGSWGDIYVLDAVGQTGKYGLISSMRTTA